MSAESDIKEYPFSSELVFFVLDRYGAPYAALVSDEPAAAELHTKMLSWLQGIGLECPE